MTSTPSKTRIRNNLALGAAALVAVAACFALAPAATARAAVEPTAVVEQTTSAVIAILTDQKLSTEEKRKRVEDVVLQRVDFETLSKLVLARNWSKFSEPQRAEFMALFKNHLSMTYGRNVESYKNEKVNITGSRNESGGDVTVKTKIVRGGSNDILVDYRLRERDGEWKIIDVIIEGVSLVSNFRSQFQDVVASGGPEQLLSLLREKNAKGEPLKTS
jgi:phospholipid transport system substrate-binding protein